MPDDLCRSDILGWSKAQAGRPRRLRRGELVNDLDWERVIEEVEDVGGGQPGAVKSHPGLAMLRARSRRSLGRTTRPRGIGSRRSPYSWRTHRTASNPACSSTAIRPNHLRALKQMRKPPPLGDVPPRPSPPMVPFTAAGLRDEGFGASDLLDRVRSALPAA